MYEIFALKQSATNTSCIHSQELLKVTGQFQIC
jgi:hypothetical protein